MTAFSDLDSAVSAFQGGAFEYLPKPFDLPKAIELIRRAVEESQREEVAEERMAAAPEMLGQAPAMQDVFRAIGRLSQSNVTVMITGESGSGKELVARALHKHSPRANGPFVAINTAAIPKDLLESELFGHERGAFTGAQTMRRGRFEQAEGGTLFLDEIGDMPFDLQTRLLRVLSDGHFYRVGGHNAVKANVRVIAATHQDLEQRVKEGVFREDLFHRLNVIRLRLPALRERARRHPDARAPFPAAKRQATGRGAQAHLRCGAGAAGDVRFSRQRAPAGKHLPLADGDGAGAADRAEGPAARRWRRQPARPDAHAAAPRAIGAHCARGCSCDALAACARGRVRRRLRCPARVPASRAAGKRAWKPKRWSCWPAAGTTSGTNSRKRFESQLILTALANTRGRRIEAAQKLGIGRNTITRKIQELGLE